MHTHRRCIGVKIVRDLHIDNAFTQLYAYTQTMHPCERKLTFRPGRSNLMGPKGVLWDVTPFKSETSSPSTYTRWCVAPEVGTYNARKASYDRK